MMKFIYVFTVSDKEQLISQGYKLLKEDMNNSIFVFESDNELSFGLADMDFVYSDTLTF